MHFHVLAEIENFRALRRQLGVARSDLLCQDLATRIISVLPGARVDIGDRRTVEIAFEGDGEAELTTALERVARASEAPFDLDGEAHHLVVVYGAAAASASADEVQVLEEAEAALAEARTGRMTVTHAMDGRADVNIDMIAEIDRALECDEFVLLYQPKLHLRRQEINSAEALIRWQHPQRGLVLPGEFIPTAESAGLIDRLTVWTIRQAIADQKRMTAAGHDLRLFINISGQLLADAKFVAEACRLVANEDDIRVGFEITETSVIRDPMSAIANLQRFADIGIRIAIDDYGAGLSSLAYLKQLPAAELKIDKLFVTQLTSSNRDPLIVRSTIDLAHAMEMEVVAEGVETHAALALLTVMGCDMVQGFLLSRPISVAALIGFLDEDMHRAVPDASLASFSRLAGAWKRA